MDLDFESPEPGLALKVGAAVTTLAAIAIALAAIFGNSQVADADRLIDRVASELGESQLEPAVLPGSALVPSCARSVGFSSVGSGSAEIPQNDYELGRLALGTTADLPERSRALALFDLYSTIALRADLEPELRGSALTAISGLDGLELSEGEGQAEISVPLFDQNGEPLQTRHRLTIESETATIRSLDTGDCLIRAAS